MITNDDNLNTERIPRTWRMYHPVSGDEKIIANDRTLTSFFRRQHLYESGYVMDDTIVLELDEDNDNG